MFTLLGGLIDDDHTHALRSQHPVYVAFSTNQTKGLADNSAKNRKIFISKRYKQAFQFLYKQILNSEYKKWMSFGQLKQRLKAEVMHDLSAAQFRQSNSCGEMERVINKIMMMFKKRIKASNVVVSEEDIYNVMVVSDGDLGSTIAVEHIISGLSLQILLAKQDVSVNPNQEAVCFHRKECKGIVRRHSCFTATLPHSQKGCFNEFCRILREISAHEFPYYTISALNELLAKTMKMTIKNLEKDSAPPVRSGVIVNGSSSQDPNQNAFINIAPHAVRLINSGSLSVGDGGSPILLPMVSDNNSPQYSAVVSDSVAVVGLVALAGWVVKRAYRYF